VARTLISAAQLYATLDREFKRLRPKECAKCNVPLPYFRKPPDEVSANWAIGTPPECPHMLARLWTRYDIEPERVQ
jgi:hypothetical protein